MVSICDLSPEILQCILKFCEFGTLCTLRETCKYLHDVVTNNRLFYCDALLTHQTNKTFQDRWRTLFMPVDKWRISSNWRSGRYKRSELCRQRVKYMPWLHVDARHVWVSWGAHVVVLERSRGRRSRRLLVPTAACGEDVTKFCVRDGHVAVATRGGCVQLVDDGRVLSRPYGPDATCVDLSGGGVVAGWRDGKVRCFPLHSSEQPCSVTTPGSDSVLCTMWNASGAAVAVGSAALTTEVPPAPLHVLDAISGRWTWQCAERRRGAGVLTCTWLAQDVLLAAGYDCAARIWDARLSGSQAACATWVEPHGDPVYSLAWDGRHAVVGGAARHGRCTLWDLRRPRRYVQMYHTHKPSQMSRSSPVYSLAIDAGELWTALDTCLAVLDFAAPTQENTPALNYDLPFLQIA